MGLLATFEYEQILMMLISSHGLYQQVEVRLEGHLPAACRTVQATAKERYEFL